VKVAVYLPFDREVSTILGEMHNQAHCIVLFQKLDTLLGFTHMTLRKEELSDKQNTQQ
jgi:hypothetical protein